MAKPASEQIQDILARYRTLPAKDKEGRDALGKMIAEASIPSYHKQILTVGLLAETDSEVVLTIEILRTEERIRHSSALAEIERRVLEARVQKSKA